MPRNDTGPDIAGKHPGADVIEISVRQNTTVPSGKVAESVPETESSEIGGPSGPEPTRYGDWEVGGRCSDF